MKSETAQAQAYRQLKSAILNRQIGLSEPLVESRLASQLGMSRTPVREALRLLQREGLITHRVGTGWQILLLDRDSLVEIFELKLILEPIAAEQATVRCQTEERGLLPEIASRMLRAAKKGDPETWRRLDEDFHRILLRLAGNRYLTQTVSDLNEKWWHVQTSLEAMRERMSPSSNEHIEIARHISEGSPELAKNAMREHLLHVQSSVLNALEAAFVLVGYAV